MLRRIIASAIVLHLAAVIFAFPRHVPAQAISVDLKKVLREGAAFEEPDLLAIENGEIVVKTLRAKDEREVVVCGVVRIDNGVEITRAAFIDSLDQKRNKSLIAGEKFTTPPRVDDLRTLKLEDRDIEDMKKCVVGKCDLKMSAAMINRLRTEVDWKAPDYRVQATQLFQKMLVEYAADYSARGDQALLQYDNGKGVVHLDEDYRAMLDGMLFLPDFAPEFGNYVRSFPRVDLAGVENSLDWSKINFGLKPIVTITHSVSYVFTRNGLSQYLIISKGIYATRYVDSSLALTMLLRLPGKTTPESYLVFTNISRSDSLGGLFGSFKQRVVANEAEAKVTDVLQRAKRRIEIVDKESLDLDPPPATSSWIVRFGAYALNPVVQIIALLSLAVIGSLIYRQFRR